MSKAKGTTLPHPRLLSGQADARVSGRLQAEAVVFRSPEITLGDIGIATQVHGAQRLPPQILVQPFGPDALVGLDPHSLRVFRRDGRSGSLEPEWNSGVNVGLSYIWAKITRPGEYVAIGLPRDRLIKETIRTLARQRQYADRSSPSDMESLNKFVLAPLLETPLEELEEIRQTLAVEEVQGSLRPRSEHPIRIRRGGYLDAFPLPGDVPLREFLDRIARLETGRGGLPEEALFFTPESMPDPDVPWPRPPIPFPRPAERWPRPWGWPWPPLPWPAHWPRPRPWFCWRWSRNWWMYQHDPVHSGNASGCSGITSTSVGCLQPRRTVPLDGSAWSIPSVVDGKIYVGTSNGPAGVGTLYKIDLATGNVEHTFDTPARPAYAPGIGGSPAVRGGRVYISNIPGTVHCLDAGTLAEIWRTDFRTASVAQNQPVNNPAADCWSGPVVINDRVYVGCGEGESDAFGFVYCLNAATGRVEWLFCTNKYSANDNAPNAIPQSAAAPWAAAAGFTIAPDVPSGSRGCSVWSSCAYDAGLNRIFVGTGNDRRGDDQTAAPLADFPYGSGVLALDATSGAFHGFYAPTVTQGYRDNDTDVDIPGSPTLFTHAGRRLVAIGSKSGAFFLLDAATLTLVRFRQLLPYPNNDRTQPLPGFDNHPNNPSENMWGVFGTPAIHYGLGRLFVGLGGYMGIDSATTPFMRALDWGTLDDAWITAKGPDNVWRYTVPQPPMYLPTGEAGLSSPAVVNDVVFIGTSKPGLYALDAATGLCLWSAGGLTGNYVLGAAISGKYVVAGAGNMLHIYSL
jgi:outer membrane protein assembly factor BamB